MAAWELIRKNPLKSFFISSFYVIFLILILFCLFESGVARYATLLVCGLTLLWAAINVIQNKKEIELESKKEKGSKATTTRMKLHAEIFAFLALISFFITYFGVGYEFDIFNKDVRMKKISEITATVAKLSNAGACNRSINSKYACKTIEDRIAAIAFSVSSGGKEEEIRKNIIAASESIDQLQSGLFFEGRSDLEIARSKLLSLDLDPTIMNLTRQMFSLLVLIFASLSISRKVAVAWHDYRTEQPKQAAK